MRIAALFRNDSAAEKRLSLALLISFFAHAALIGAIRIAPPQLGIPQALRASIVPYSMPDVSRLDSAQSLEALREINRSLTAPREPGQEDAKRNSAPQDPDKASGAAIGIAAELPIYYRNDEVNVRATPRRSASTSSAERSLLLGRLVKVKLRLFISDSGTVDYFEILEAQGMTPAVTLEDVREISFYPAQRNGRPVRSQKVLELTFTP